MSHRKKKHCFNVEKILCKNLKLIVQSGWEMINGRSKNKSQRTFATFICISAIKAKSLSEWVSLCLSIVESL